MSADLTKSVGAILQPKGSTQPVPGRTLPSPQQMDAWDDDPYHLGGFQSNGYLPPRSTSTYRPNMATPTYKPKTVSVIYKNGERTSFSIPWEGNGWFELAADAWQLLTDPTKPEIVSIPSEFCEFSYETPAFNPCVFTATDDYLQARWGRRLDATDKAWLARHPLSTDGGVPQEYTATCIQQLMQPYGMRVSRIRLRKGSVVLGPSVMEWLMALGCNPFAMADRSTTNAEAAERLGMSVADADALWRVEFSDDPLPCSVIGERGWSGNSTTGVAVGNLGGHARYLAPRGYAGDWFISLQLEPDEKVTYLTPPPDPVYEPRKGRPSLLYAKTLAPDNTLLAVKDGTTWRRPGDMVHLPAGSAPTPPAGSTPTPAHTFSPPLVEALTPPPGMVSTKPSQFPAYKCCVCETEYPAAHDLFDDTAVCCFCVMECWDNSPCPHCNADMGKRLPFALAHYPDPDTQLHTFVWECGSCREEVQIEEPSDMANATEAQLREYYINLAVFHNVSLGWDAPDEEDDMPEVDDTPPLTDLTGDEGTVPPLVQADIDDGLLPPLVT